MARLYDYAIEKPKITSHYGWRIHPISKKKSFHYGVDLISGTGNRKLFAIEDGYVQMVVTNQSKATTGYGNRIWIRYPRINISVMYAHCEEVYLKKNDKVKKGDVVAKEGKTGAATGVHVHFGMTKIGSDTWLNPETYDYIPPKTEEVTPTVDRNEYKDQLKVVTTQLRVRKDHNTKADIIGIAKKEGIYNYYEVVKDGGYDWYRIADKQWIANNGKYLEIYPKKEEETDKEKIARLEKELSEANTKIDELNKNLDSKEKELEEANLTLEKQRKEIIEKDKIIVEKDKKIEELEKQENYKFKYEAPKTGEYQIHLIEKETLYIK